MRTFTISGQTFHLDRARVCSAVAEQLPEPLQEHFVIVDGRRYPPKQVIAAVTGLDRADFTTHQARRVLTRLGFVAARQTYGKGGGVAVPDAARGPFEGRQAEALRPFIGRWVAIRGLEVLVAADSPADVVAWLSRHGQQADSMFRVPADAGSVGGAAPV